MLVVLWALPLGVVTNYTRVSTRALYLLVTHYSTLPLYILPIHSLLSSFFFPVSSSQPLCNAPPARITFCQAYAHLKMDFFLSRSDGGKIGKSKNFIFRKCTKLLVFQHYDFIASWRGNGRLLPTVEAIIYASASIMTPMARLMAARLHESVIRKISVFNTGLVVQLAVGHAHTQAVA